MNGGLWTKITCTSTAQIRGGPPGAVKIQKIHGNAEDHTGKYTNRDGKYTNQDGKYTNRDGKYTNRDGKCHTNTEKITAHVYISKKKF